MVFTLKLIIIEARIIKSIFSDKNRYSGLLMIVVMYHKTSKRVLFIAKQENTRHGHCMIFHLTNNLRIYLIS
jgi:hypothetical protein